MLPAVVYRGQVGISVIVDYGHHLDEHPLCVYALCAGPRFALQCKLGEVLDDIFANINEKSALFKKTAQSRYCCNRERVEPDEI